jgi:hypothetical protein
LEDEARYQQYINDNGAEYRPAPAEIGRQVGGPCGLMLVPVYASARAPPPAALDGSGATARGIDRAASFKMGGRGSSVFESGEMDSDEDEDIRDDDYVCAALQRRINELQEQQQALLAANVDLQKKASALIAREKMIIGQSAAGRLGTAGDGAAPSTAGTDAIVSAVTDTAEVLTAEQTLEKNKQYKDLLQQVVDERAKLTKQHREFEQLGVDLQTRLDDKEFKVNGVSKSFKTFKK